MPSSRETLIKLSGLGTSALVALAAHHFGAGEAPGIVGGGIALLGMMAEASFGHMGLQTVHDLAKRYGSEKTARGRENRDLHRVIGETIANILEESMDHASGGNFVFSYVKEIARDFRGERWMNVQLSGPETAVAEKDISNYFSGDADVIKNTPVLEKDEWVALFGKVYGAPTQVTERQHALDFAATQLREHFAFKLWESLKRAWKQGDLAWPALILRLLSELLGRASVSEAELPKVRNEIASLRDAVLKRAEPAMAAAPPSAAILVEAIHEYQAELTSQLNRIESKIDTGVTTIRGDIADLRSDVEAAIAKPVKLQLKVDRDRQRMIRRGRLDWIDGWLKQSLYEIARIELCMESAEKEVERPWNALVQVPDRVPVPIHPGKTAGRIFDDLGQSLLILGAPGTGKTTFLLELTEELLDRAEQDEGEPMPVVFNLSSWAVFRMPLERWLIAEMNERSGVPKKCAKRWVESDQITPLLDGLDEVAQEHRAACVEAINAFRKEHGLLPMAICSRTADYHELSIKLRMQNAILIQSLTRGQVEDYLLSAGEQLRGLRVAVRDDPSLWELLETPLMLWVAVLAYRDATVVFSSDQNLEQRRNILLDRFVDAMLKRRGAETKYSRVQTTDWLSSLARTMVRMNQSVFYLEGINLDSLPIRRGPLLRATITLVTALVAPVLPLTAYWLAVVILYLVGALLSAGPSPPIWVPMGMGLVGATMLGAVFGAYLAVGPEAAIPAERVHWKRARFVSVAISWKVLGYGLLFFALVQAVVGYSVLLRLAPSYRSTSRPVDWLIQMPICLFGAVALTYLNKSLEVEQPLFARPNEGMRNSVTNALRWGLFSALAAGIPISIGFAGYFSRGDSGKNAVISGAIAGALAGMCIAGGVGLFKGGLFVLQNLFARLALWISGAAPLRYMPFLEFAVGRLFLQRVGAGYSFAHRLIMEHFAAMPKSPRSGASHSGPLTSPK